MDYFDPLWIGCPIFSKSCQIILPKNYIVRNVIIKPYTDFQLFSQLSWSPAMSHKVRPDPFISWKKILQSTLCGYSKLVSWDVWLNAKGEKWSDHHFNGEKSKHCWKFEIIQFSTVFEHFLIPGRSDQFQVFSKVLNQSILDNLLDSSWQQFAIDWQNITEKQAGAELCQAKHSLS